MSARPSRSGRACHCSGAMYGAVPSTMPVVVSLSSAAVGSPRSLATPKSRTFTNSGLAARAMMNTLSGFRSRWTVEGSSYDEKKSGSAAPGTDLERPLAVSLRSGSAQPGKVNPIASALTVSYLTANHDSAAFLMPVVQLQVSRAMRLRGPLLKVNPPRTHVYRRRRAVVI